jgi:hypothetical protein
METLDSDSNGGVSRQKSFGKEGAVFFSTNVKGGKIRAVRYIEK